MHGKWASLSPPSSRYHHQKAKQQPQQQQQQQQSTTTAKTKKAKKSTSSSILRVILLASALLSLSLMATTTMMQFQWRHPPNTASASSSLALSPNEVVKEALLFSLRTTTTNQHHRRAARSSLKPPLRLEDNVDTASPMEDVVATSTEGQAVGDYNSSNSSYYYYRSMEEAQGRSRRFPSVDERLRVYLSTYYTPPCADDDNSNGFVRYHYVEQQQQNDSSSSSNKTAILVREAEQTWSSSPTATSAARTYYIDSSIQHSRNMFLLHQDSMLQCKNKFCRDVNTYLVPSLNRLQQQQQQHHMGGREDNYVPPTFPVLLQFGDAEQFRAIDVTTGHSQNYPNIPVIKKFRYSMTKSDLDRVTNSQRCYRAHAAREVTGTSRAPDPQRPQAIVSIVSNYDRHFGRLIDVPAMDTVWEKKRNAAVWRGAMTGRNRGVRKNTQRQQSSADENKANEDLCRQIPRCHLVLQYGNSSLVDARLIRLPKKGGTSIDPISSSIYNVSMFGDPMTIEEMLQFKAIVMLEGNDVSSGFKWAMFSESVVLTQQPTCTSWAMEELLQPWVHYIPIKEDVSDVAEKMQWVIDNDAKAREIARAGKLWITDLVFHPDAKAENEQIIDETLRRYAAHFRKDTDLPSSAVVAA
jgi:Glycosyl transferase family 90